MRTSDSDKEIVEAVFPVRNGIERGLDESFYEFDSKNLRPSILRATEGFSKKKLNFIMNCLIGIEVEAENAKQFKYIPWIMDRDNSLRGDNAFEFKTKYGLRCFKALEALKELCEFAKQNDFSYSERTSIHIHLDVRRLRVKHLRTLMQLYLLFEDALFKYAGEWRAQNIFCVPVSKSDVLPSARGLDMVEFTQGWNKYSALNLAAINLFGTIEFRHMEGNCDYVRISNWILLLLCLLYAAWDYKEEEVYHVIRSLRCDSEFNLLAEKIFGPYLSKQLVLDQKKMLEATTQAKLFVCPL